MDKCDEYTICACSHADDLHCMYCCQPMYTHDEIPESEIKELQIRILAGAEING